MVKDYISKEKKQATKERAKVKREETKEAKLDKLLEPIRERTAQYLKEHPNHENEVI